MNLKIFVILQLLAVIVFSETNDAADVAQPSKPAEPANNATAATEPAESATNATNATAATEPAEPATNATNATEPAESSRKKHIRKAAAMPVSFDIRQIYSECDFAIYEEGICTGNWAVSIADTISDLICIQKNNTDMELSPQQLVDCVDRGSNTCKNATIPNLIKDALDFIVGNGITTEDCYPYISEFTGIIGEQCAQVCTNNNTINQTVNVTGYVNLDGVDNIKNFIINNGSVHAVIKYYSDLLLYTEGVYTADTNKLALGYHSIKIVGWAVNNGVEYWIAANSWGLSWGANGYFQLSTADPGFVQVTGIIIA